MHVDHGPGSVRSKVLFYSIEKKLAIDNPWIINLFFLHERIAYILCSICPTQFFTLRYITFRKISTLELEHEYCQL